LENCSSIYPYKTARNPGGSSQGETIDETIENTKEAIEAYLIALKEDDLEIPVEEDLFIGKVRVGAAVT